MKELESDCFQVEIADRVAHLRLNRPEALNTMTVAFWNDLPRIVRFIDSQALARAIVISSTGRHFTAGMDLAVFGSGSGITAPSDADRYVAAEKFTRDVRLIQDSISCLEQARMPVIAAVQGGCIGGGVDLVSACDIRFAASDAYFCIQEINIGMTADVGTFPRLARVMPEGWVRQMAYTGEKLPAAKALALGFVNEVLPDHLSAVSHALGVAREIATKSPLAVAGSKVMLNYARDHTTADCLDYIGVWNAAMLAGPHLSEAFRARIEKRPAVFPDLLPLRGTAL
jgi:enoyl-CoA hydratase